VKAVTQEKQPEWIVKESLVHVMSAITSGGDSAHRLGGEEVQRHGAVQSGAAVVRPSDQLLLSVSAPLRVLAAQFTTRWNVK
jgi:hypothetical protein